MTKIPGNPGDEFTWVFSDNDYLRQRISPRRRDVNYLHFQDVLRVLKRVAPEIRGDLFDYGCGSAPYHALFSNCKNYVAADMQAGPAVKKVLKSDGTTGEADASYDAVLSSQVLEHVPRPDAYLRECARILKAGGELILTTHGMFEEHGCPHDFTRWTSKGLEELVSKCGFQIIESCKLTTEMRAAVQLTNQIVLHFRCRERPLIHFVLAAARKIYFAVFAPVLNWFADAFPEQAVVPGSSTNSLYSCIYVRARKL